MMKIENVRITGFEEAVRGARNSFDSWDRSDSRTGENGFVMGDADKRLLLKLVQAGDAHAKALRMVTVYADITAPRYWWTEFDTYRHVVRCSCSTMHTITKKPFEMDSFACDEFLENNALSYVLCALNIFRENFLRDKDRKWWKRIIQLLPQSYIQRSTVMMNYQVLRNIYLQRKGHRLSEWHEFREWAETLPYAGELICI